MSLILPREQALQEVEVLLIEHQDHSSVGTRQEKHDTESQEKKQASSRSAAMVAIRESR